MSPTRIILFIILILSPVMTIAQEQLDFSPAEWDFGTIRESDGRVSHTFTGRNTGDRPLAILDVVTTCGCTAPEFSRRPVLPDGEVEIRVTYDPANRPGTFEKELAVYSTERRKIATLTIRGQVTPREKSIEELYPVAAGNGLRLSETLCAFSYVYPDRPVRLPVGYANTSDRTLRLELRPETESGLLTAEYPRTIGPGERGRLWFSYLNPSSALRYGTLRDTFALLIDGHDSGKRIGTYGIGVDNPADMSRSAYPKAQVAKNIIKFGPVKHSDAPRTMSFTLANEGTAPLTVRAVELTGKIGSSLRPGATVPPGEELAVSVTLDPREQDYGAMTARIQIITDDPARPMRRVRVTAIIEE